MAAVERELMRPKDGLALLFAPPFDKTSLQPGCIKGALLGAAPLLGACDATAGAGKDISKVGDKIEEEAVENTP